MTIYSGIFNSVRDSNGQGDRKYNAWWFAKYFSTFIGNGVFPNPSTNLQVIAGENMTVVVKPGNGWIDGYFIHSDNDHILQLAVADGVLKRIDRVVMRLNYLTRQIEIAVKKGTSASNPVAPTLQRDTDAYELVLADIHVNNGVTQITQAAITDTRLNSELCGIVHGTVDQVDTTTIFNQYQSWFDNYTTQQQADFEAWLDDIGEILDGDVAGNLINLIQANTTAINNLNGDLVDHADVIATENLLGHIKAPTEPDGKIIFPKTKEVITELNLTANATSTTLTDLDLNLYKEINITIIGRSASQNFELIFNNTSTGGMADSIIQNGANITANNNVSTIVFPLATYGHINMFYDINILNEPDINKFVSARLYSRSNNSAANVTNLFGQGRWDNTNLINEIKINSQLVTGAKIIVSGVKR